MAESLYDIPLKTIDGAPASLKDYAGQVLLIVNVASACGLTPQYEGLEKLYEADRAKGLVVLGFPANEFGGQEPGTEAEIKDFCTTKFDVHFPMFSKVVAKGPGQHPLYKALTEAMPEAQFKPDSQMRERLASRGLPEKPGDVLWNFEKFLVGRDGQVKARFSPDTPPDHPLVTAAVEKALAEPA